MGRNAVNVISLPVIKSFRKQKTIELKIIWIIHSELEYNIRQHVDTGSMKVPSLIGI